MLWCDLFCIIISVDVKYLRWRFLLKIVSGPKYGVFSGPYFPVLGLNTEIYWTECGDLRSKSPHLVRIEENTLFHLISWYGNFVERHSFSIVPG